ncbi:HindVP family restriction endonuclease [Candidatus Parcubacteria bacterium]|nr:MAG: HindVP family restriction endonuclease [Candidatus Parcubacteria bacterium]
MEEKNCSPSLYGLKNSNRDFSNQYYWGKNQFNSSFPTALACYMRDKDIKAVYLKVDQDLNVLKDEITINELFGQEVAKNSDLYYSFESIFDPYRKYVRDELDKIDLVVKKINNSEGDDSKYEFLSAVEIKLTTLPDNGTSSKTEDEYGSELVIRPATTKYLALSIVDALSDRRDEVREIFEDSCSTIRDWGNKREIEQSRESILLALDEFFKKFHEVGQRPILLNAVWKTEGKTPKLAENCLDIFVWSTFALSRLFMDPALEQVKKGEEIKRQQRAALRLARFIYQWSESGRVHQQPIYDGMTYDLQNDKEFAASGNKTNKYMRCARLTKPSIKRTEIKNIVLCGGEKWLSPERRFDAILYYDKDLFQ